MRYRLRTLLLLTAVAAVSVWLYTRNATSQHHADWGTVKRSSIGPDTQVWRTTADGNSKQTSIAFWESGDALDLNDASLEASSLCVARQTGPNSVNVKLPNDDQPVVSVAVAAAMALDQRNFKIDPSLRAKIGDENPVYVTVDRIGTFTIYYVNDWGNYRTTKTHGPSAHVLAYEKMADSKRPKLKR